MNQQIISTELVAVKPCRACGAVDRNKSGRCKPCKKHSTNKWSMANPDKVRDIQQKYYEANREQVLRRVQKYREDNVDRLANRYRNWVKSNPEKKAISYRNWVKANTEKVKIRNQNRRARIKGNGGKLSTNIVQTLLTKQNNKCVCCGASLDNGYHLDHIMPLALGGMNDDQNVQLLTPKCNLSKSDKHPDVWAGEKGIKLS